MEWRSIPGYERYKVSEDGQIKGVDGRILKLGLSGKKKAATRYKVQLFRNSAKKTFFTHRLVALAFIPNPKGLPQINHKDGNRYNNHYQNLEWSTHLDNVNHAYENGIMGVSRKYDFKTLSHDEIIAIRNFPIPVTNTNGGKQRKMLCEKYGISLHVVKDIRSGRSWAHIK